MKTTDFSLGHLTTSQMAEVKDLEWKADQNIISDAELLDLALLRLEPGHDAFAAIDSLGVLLERNPTNDVARVWLAFTLVLEIMDQEAFVDAIRIADEVSESNSRLRAGALRLKSAALRELGRLSLSIAAGEESVRLEPEWISNRLTLAAAYREVGRKSEAIGQLQMALTISERLELRNPEDPFELFITGRTRSSEQTVRDELSRLIG